MCIWNTNQERVENTFLQIITLFVFIYLFKKCCSNWVCFTFSTFFFFNHCFPFLHQNNLHNFTPNKQISRNISVAFLGTICSSLALSSLFYCHKLSFIFETHIRTHLGWPSIFGESTKFAWFDQKCCVEFVAVFKWRCRTASISVIGTWPSTAYIKFLRIAR